MQFVFKVEGLGLRLGLGLGLSFLFDWLFFGGNWARVLVLSRTWCAGC